MMENLIRLMLVVFSAGVILISCSSNEEEAAEDVPEEDTTSVQITEPDEPDEEDEIENTEQTETEIEYTEDGNFTLQVESWRSEQRAEQRANSWKERGFDHVYVVKHESEDPGEIWYRVRIGNFSNQDMAELVRVELAREHKAESWVTIRD